jgi:hypothetical protein
MFNPEAIKSEARRQQPALDEAYKKAEQAVRDYVDPLISYFNGLEVEISDMPIAQRFRRDRKPEHFATSRMVHPMFAELSEADFKRAEIKSHLEHIRAAAMNLAMGIEGLVMDIEATKVD